MPLAAVLHDCHRLAQAFLEDYMLLLCLFIGKNPSRDSKPPFMPESHPKPYPSASAAICNQDHCSIGRPNNQTEAKATNSSEDAGRCSRKKRLELGDARKQRLLACCKHSCQRHCEGPAVYVCLLASHPDSVAMYGCVLMGSRGCCKSSRTQGKNSYFDFKLGSE